MKVRRRTGSAEASGEQRREVGKHLGSQVVDAVTLGFLACEGARLVNGEGLVITQDR
jgi:hypothetical protein